MNEEIVFNDVKVTTHPDGLFIRENGHVVFLTWEEIQRVSDIAKLTTAYIPHYFFLLSHQ